jgi:hypothetical protein
LPQAALLVNPAPRNGPPAPSKPSSNDASQAGGGAGGGGDNGGSGSVKPGSHDSDSSTEWAPPIVGSPTPPAGPNSSGNVVTAGLDVSPGGVINVSINTGPVDVSVNPGPIDVSLSAGPIEVSVGTGPIDVSVGAGPIDVSVNAGLVDVSVEAQATLTDLLGFDVSLGSNGIFVGADIEVGLPLTVDQLGSNPVQIVESTTGIELNNLLNADLPAVDALLGAGEDLSQVKATLAEVTGLSFVSGPGGSSGGTLPATLAEPVDTLSSTSPVPIEVVSGLTDLGSNGQSGDLASGGVITLPVPAANDAVQIDNLFAAGQYTEYNVALQSLGNSDATSVSAPANNEPVDQPVTTPAVGDISPDQHDSGGVLVSPTPVELSVPLEDIKFISGPGLSS